MAFDIRQNLFDRDGMPSEKKTGKYEEQLIELFRESPEGQAIWDEEFVPGFWVHSLIDYGIQYLSVSPAQMTPNDLRELLFDIFPRKVSADADEAPQAIRELQAFWQFVQREFQLENAASLLKVLDDKAVRQMKREMSNPANFGMAKSIVMMGKTRGFDMTTEEGINEWITTYNAEMATRTASRPSLFGDRSGDTGSLPGSGTPISSFAWLSGSSTNSTRKAKNKLKRKMARESHKRNRGK